MEQALTAIVTGGSSGIGLCTALALKERGCRVYTLSRRERSAPGLCHLRCDVTDEAAVKNALEKILSREGRVDILVNCAGYGISGAVEFTGLSDAKRQFDVNFFGMDRVTRAVLGVMRRQGSGRVVNISSVAAVAHIPFQTYYSATKAAIESYTCALANEVKPFGITVTCAQPGDIRTGFTDAREKFSLGDDVYAGRIGRSVSRMEEDERKGMEAEKAGKMIASIALKKRVKPIYTLGFGYQVLSFLCRVLPCGLRNRIVGMLYAR